MALCAARHIDDERNTKRPDRIGDAWRELRTMLAGEITTINMLMKLHKLDRAYAVVDHPIWEVAYAAQLDIAVGTSLARIKVCARSGELLIDHFAEGVPSFACKSLRLNCLAATRRDLQALLSVLLRSSMAGSKDKEAP